MKARHDHLVTPPLTNMRMRAFIEERQPVGLDLALCAVCHDRPREQTIRN